jgi:hypothetical protein
MSRIIHSDSPARMRASVLESIRVTLAALELGTDVEQLDRLAFLVLALRQLQASVEQTAEAWERRSYWVKVDQFRRAWSWVGQGAQAVADPLRRGDAALARKAAHSLGPRLPPGRPTRARDLTALWTGAYARLTQQSETRNDP